MTTKELAEKLGVSRGTVSRVLNNNPNVNKETRKMVLKALKKYNYTPNHAARSLIMKREKRIGVVVFSQPKYFWEQVRRGVCAATQELAHTGLRVEYIVTDISNKGAQQNEVIRLVDEGVDAIALAPSNPELMQKALNYAKEKNVPIVLFNVDIKNSGVLCYTGENYIKAGRIAAELTAKHCKKESGRITALTVEQPLAPLDERLNAFEQALSEYGNLKLNAVQRFERLPKNVTQTVISILEKGETDAFFVNFDAATQVAEALLKLNLAREIPVICFDYNAQISKHLKNGAISATIFHSPFSQGREAVYILYNYLFNTRAPEKERIYTKPEIIVAENSEFYSEFL